MKEYLSSQLQQLPGHNFLEQSSQLVVVAVVNGGGIGSKKQCRLVMQLWGEEPSEGDKRVWRLRAHHFDRLHSCTVLHRYLRDAMLGGGGIKHSSGQ